MIEAKYVDFEWTLTKVSKNDVIYLYNAPIWGDIQIGSIIYWALEIK